MSSYDVLATTIRSGLAIDEIEFVVPGQQPSTGYFVRHRPGTANRAVLALHDQRGDKAALLPEVRALGERGFWALSIDCPTARDAMRRRDAVGALAAMRSAGQIALSLLDAKPDITGHRIAICGHGLGGEAAGSLTALTPGVRVVVTTGSLLHRGAFLREADHPLAAGARLHLGESAHAQAAVLDRDDLASTMHATSERHWLVQVADDDDRYTDEDRRELAFGVPASARISEYPSTAALQQRGALRERVDFIDEMT